MTGHDRIVIGSSAGGVSALQTLVRGLPADLSAAVLVVQHVPPTHSVLPAILARAGPLPAAHARDGESIEEGRIYVAPPDNHLVAEDDTVRVVHGPKENGWRPAVDSLFRTAAVSWGSRVVAVVLTGALNDGAAGARDVKRCGGLVVVQDVNDAAHPSMPRSVLQAVEVDHQLPLAEIAPLLARLSRQRVSERRLPVPDDLRIEAEITGQRLTSTELVERVQKLGRLTALTCPECHGSLWELDDKQMLRFRCHVGHAFTADSLYAESSRETDGALWFAVRAVEEKGMTAQRLAQQARQRGLGFIAVRFEQRAEEAFHHVDALRGLVLRAPTDAEADDEARRAHGSEAEREPSAEPPDPQGAR